MPGVKPRQVAGQVDCQAKHREHDFRPAVEFVGYEEPEGTDESAAEICWRCGTQQAIGWG